MIIYQDPKKELNESEKAVSSLKVTHCIILFVIGFAGFQLLGTVLSTICTNIIVSVDNVKIAELTQAQKNLLNIKIGAFTNFFTYLLLLGILVGLLFAFDKKGTLGKLKAFTKGGTYLFALFVFLAMLGLNILYSQVENAIMNAINITGTNANQAGLNQQLLSYGYLVIPFTVLFAPITEEITYRLGLFEAIRRYSRVWAYIAVVVVFASIHVLEGIISSIQSSSRNDLYIELLSIPTYMIGGLFLSYAYDKYRNPTHSFLVHCFNNLLSVVMLYISIAINNRSGNSSSIISTISYLIPGFIR